LKREWLVNLRKEKTQQNVADHIGTTRQAISHIEQGFRNPSIKMAQNIAAMLEFPWEWFYDEKRLKRECHYFKEKTG
jgi:DNA-binding XRE family transcriptional regulator